MTEFFDSEGVNIQARQLGDRLQTLGFKVATAESCTGGLLAGALTSVPGSSGWFDQGWVTYTNKAKMQQLGVDSQTLREFGAVSESVARQMAAGALAMAQGAQLSLATTGIAGPGGATQDKPVGLVWFGFAMRSPDGVIVTASFQQFDGNRAQVRHSSVEYALTQALLLLQTC